MDLEFYDTEKHDFFLDAFKQYSREPDTEEKKFFREVIEEIVEEISNVTNISTDFKLYFAITDQNTLDPDLSINRYVHGFSFAKWMEGFDRNVIMIRAVKNRSNWRDCLVNMLAHEMAHQEFYSANEEAPYSNLSNIIFEGHAMNRAEQVTEELGIEWKPHYRSDKSPDIDAETIVNLLNEDRVAGPSSIFENGSSPCEQAEGYQISYLVVKYLVEEEGINLSEIPKEKITGDQVEKILRAILD